MVWKLALALAIGYAALVGVMYVMQDHLIYFPGTGREHAATPATFGLPYEDVSIQTEDGETLNAWWLPAAQRETRGTVLLFHGNAGNISHRIEYARMFRALAYNTLLVDYRGYGKSTGAPSEEGTYRDAIAAWRWLTETRGVPPGEIAIFGESLGGAVACWLARERKPRALMLASTFTSVPDLGAEVYGFVPVRLISRFRYNTRECLPKVDAPVFIAHSPRDDIIPYSHGQALYAAAREPKQFLDLAGGHNDGFVYVRPEWAKAIGVFLSGSETSAVTRP